ncbi:MAG: LysR family transcriptional regulator [Brachybacterium sp.]|nr:LysR family transcriptional regulator [Brachybacterium sp.]
MTSHRHSTAFTDRDLAYVTAIARSGSFRAAARELGVSPSAVLRALRGVESRLGCVLFDRTPQGVRPTEAGETVVRHAYEREDLAQQLQRDLSRLAHAQAGEIRVAVGKGFIDELSTGVLTDFIASHPGVAIRLHSGGTRAMTDLLRHDEVDLAVVLHPEPDSRLRVVASLPQPVGLVCPRGHDLTRHSPLAPSALRTLGELRLGTLPHGFGLRSLQDEFLRAHRLEAHLILESDSQPLIVRSVATGHCLALLPPISIPSHLSDRVTLVPLDEAHLGAVRATILTRAGRRLGPAAQAFVDACATSFGRADADATPLASS